MLANRARTALFVSLGLAALVWGCYLLALFAGPAVLHQLGILPRRVDGLDGILFGPLLHAGINHLLGNTLPLVVFSFLTLLEGVRRYLVVLASSWLASGLGVWLFGGGLTVGISGVVFGLFAYLMVRGIYNRDLVQLLLGGILFLVYGSLLWGVLPVSIGVSWQAHLFGAAGGVLAAVLLSRHRQRGRTSKSGPSRWKDPL
ncbi:rhomboid family intramembrane serine protease [Arthrobacter sp. zg-Y820]|uniref:rhomboid family intramembrane serine protease n=1 Tax=unclassified Arthrobacter TaxID=235627 RepID=UPI00253F9CB6|nr:MULTISPECIES: rhomboid family intramembrane serine protease [unclassified Arthrobacter]MCC9195553.1 rhomboid family intramembrane serine protease [Arthrobacter sp. zg-Y820]MDK1278412.1 rhomboid family intramembrane serine protease [Arthrobacter sp. zg.Y820]WIB10281.1 rhomboid family intramembrane serine protease [Arthrobacter sp. zg-Y820]